MPPFFDKTDEQRAKAYVESAYGQGAFDPVIGTDSERDAIVLAALQSARDYMRQSVGTRNALGQEFRVFPAIVNSISPNAFAGLHNGLHVCGLHAGLHAIIFEIACFVMAQADMFVDIGDPTKEASPRYSQDSLPAFWLVDQTLRGAATPDPVFSDQLLPRCPHRYHFAIYLTILMQRFVWFHELFHALNGHVGYLAQFSASVRLNEVPDTSRASLVEWQMMPLPLPSGRLLQALELDADRTALYGAYRTQIEDKENIVGIASLPRPLRLNMTLFTAILMTFLIEQCNIRQNTPEATTHPGSYTRLHDMIRTMAIHLTAIDADVQGRFHSVLSDFRTLARALSALPNVERLLLDLEDARFQETLDAHERDLDALRPMFAPLAYA